MVESVWAVKAKVKFKLNIVGIIRKAL